MPQSKIGHRVFGTAVLASGVVNLVWHHGPIYLYALAAGQIIGGVAIAFRPAAKAGAAIIGAAYLVYALLSITQIFVHPQVYATWGNFFYPFANVIGAAASTKRLRIACILFGVCNLSFAIEQVEFLARTASLVPPWLPPSQMFWAFGLLVWVPQIISNPHSQSNWSEGTETVAIGAAAWILAELLARSRASDQS